MLFKYSLIIFSFICLNTESKEFIRNYDGNGNLISEGWVQNGEKNYFWTFYHSNGEISKKGHFLDGRKDGYWYFYNQTGDLIKEGTYTNDVENDWWVFYNGVKMTKTQFNDGFKDGYALIYLKGKLKKAERYKANKKIGEWTSYFKFRKDNPNVDF